MRIGRRLGRVLENIDYGLDTIVDVGTDHGFLALKAIENRGAKKVIATDISAGSLSKAIDLAKKYGYEQKIVCVQTDGIQALGDDFFCDMVVIAGVGANETIKILESIKNKKNIKSYLLQPMQDVEVLREYLMQAGFTSLVDETIKDRDKFYHIIKCNYTGIPEKPTVDKLFVGKTDAETIGKDFLDELTETIIKLESRKSHLSKNEKQKLKIYKKYSEKFNA